MTETFTAVEPFGILRGCSIESRCSDDDDDDESPYGCLIEFEVNN